MLDCTFLFSHSRLALVSKQKPKKNSSLNEGALIFSFFVLSLSLSVLLRSSFFCKTFSTRKPMAENGVADDAAAASTYVLPEKWSDDIVDEKGEKMSKT